MTEDLAGRLEAAVARHIGAPGAIFDFSRLTGGANKTTYSFDAQIGGERRPFIVQLAAAAKIDVPQELLDLTPRVTAEEDAKFMIAAYNHGVPAPRVRAILDDDDGLGLGYITERIEGETLAPRILREERFAHARSIMARQCGEILAKIHAIPLSEVSFLHYQDAAMQVQSQRKVLDYFDFRLPALELGLRWAAENLPKNPRHTPVHGDFRHGNFIVGEEGIRAVLDWEVAQSGDPMQDLGWVCVKTWRFGGKGPVGGFGRREDMFEAYEKASGIRVDPAHVRFWEAFGCVKWALGCLRLGTRGVEEVWIERSTIGRRIEEPLWDFINLIDGKD